MRFLLSQVGLHGQRNCVEAARHLADEARQEADLARLFIAVSDSRLTAQGDFIG
jgi:hypothetical protein